MAESYCDMEGLERRANFSPTFGGSLKTKMNNYCSPCQPRTSPKAETKADGKVSILGNKVERFLTYFLTFVTVSLFSISFETLFLHVLACLYEACIEFLGTHSCKDLEKYISENLALASQLSFPILPLFACFVWTVLTVLLLHLV